MNKNFVTNTAPRWLLAFMVALSLIMTPFTTHADDLLPPFSAFTLIASGDYTPPPVEAPQPLDYTSGDLVCLAKNIYYEARGEGELGQIAVGLVTLNRLKDPKFPNSLCGVVTQKTQTEAGKVCQFSWVCSLGFGALPVGATWEISMQLARMLLDGGHVTYQEMVNGAKYFHATNVKPGWGNLVRVAKIGNHVFYR